MMKREKMPYALLMTLFLSIGTIVGCSEGKSNEADEKVPLTVAQLLQEVDTRVGDTIVVEGVCNWVCEHRGCKLTIMGDSEGQKITIAHDEASEKFGPELAGRWLRVTGVVEEARFDSDYLDAWEARIKAAEEAGEVAPESCEISLNRIADYRTEIAEREAKEGKAYFSVFSVKSSKVETVE